MTILRAYKTELEPNNKQASIMSRCCGTARYVYNWGLAEWQRQYEAGEKPSRFRLCKQFNAQKDELCPWVREIPYAVAESAFVNLGMAFQHFFRRVRDGEEQAGYPKFKKRGKQNSSQFRNTRVENDKVRLTGIGWVRLKEHGYLPATESGAKFGTYATVSERAGRWFISVQVYEEMPKPELDDTLIIGVDLGLKSLATCSDGMVFENPKPLREAQRKLARLQRELSRRQKGGKNWKKTKTKIAKLHYQITNIRKYALHEVSHYVVQQRPGAIILEDLNVKGMVKNRCLARAISDVGFSELRRQIEYKAEWLGIDIIIADRWFPSSRLCPVCGAINENLTLADREWTCECGAVHDRDLNAARNLASLVRNDVNRETHGVYLGS